MKIHELINELLKYPAGSIVGALDEDKEYKIIVFVHEERFEGKHDGVVIRIKTEE